MKPLRRLTEIKEQIIESPKQAIGIAVFALVFSLISVLIVIGALGARHGG